MRRRAVLICFIISIGMLLSGCEGLWGNYRAIERLMLVETMGFDTERGSVRLSLSSAADSLAGKPPKRLTAAGANISAAMEHAFNYSYEKELFCYHVDTVLIGEAAAEENLDSILAYICQSPFMRVDVPLFVVREGTAEQAVMELGEGSEGSAEVLRGALEHVQSKGGGSLFSAADVIRNSERRGSALICAISCAPSTESSAGGQASADGEGQSSGGGGGQASGGGESQSSGSGETAKDGGGKAAAATGYAVIRDGKLCSYIEPEDVAALGLLLNDPGVAQLQVRDRHGQLAVLETDSGSSTVEPVWSAPGVLEGINLRVKVRASVLEVSGRGELLNAEYADHLTAQLEKQLLERVNSLLESSKKLRADFMGLGERVQRAAPEQYELMKTEFCDALPALRVTATVSGELSHTNDMKDD